VPLGAQKPQKATTVLGHEYEGVIGVAINGVGIVGKHVHKDTGEEGAMTMTFDDCGGHGDSDHRYHYHIPPYCLLRSLGGTRPKNADWWLAKHPEAQWPAEAEKDADRDFKSPLLGWAVDGFPIYGPYDPLNGKLMVSSNQGCASELDQCNGKFLDNGQYAYFITPTAPFVPQCLRGAKIGKFSDAAVMGPDGKPTICPAAGYSPANVTTPVVCRKAPMFLFSEVPPELMRWHWASMCVGICYTILLFIVAWIGRPSELHKVLPIRRLQKVAETTREKWLSKARRSSKILLLSDQDTFPAENSPNSLGPRPDAPAPPSMPGDVKETAKTALKRVGSLVRTGSLSIGDEYYTPKLMAPEGGNAAGNPSALTEGGVSLQFQESAKSLRKFGGQFGESVKSLGSVSEGGGDLFLTGAGEAATGTTRKLQRRPSLVIEGKVVSNFDEDPDTENHLRGLFWCLFRMWASVLVICVTRSIFLLVDPYTMRATLPRMAEGLLYGTIYPCLNLCAVEILWLVGLYEWPKVYRWSLWMMFLQFCTQWIMDALRAEALHPAWHYVCQIFYITWGAAVLITGFVASRKANNLVVSVDTLLSFFAVIISIVLLCVQFGGPEDDRTFSIETVLRIVELVATLSYAKCIHLCVRDNTPPDDKEVSEWVDPQKTEPTFRMRRLSSVTSLPPEEGETRPGVGAGPGAPPRRSSSVTALEGAQDGLTTVRSLGLQPPPEFIESLEQGGGPITPARPRRWSMPDVDDGGGGRRMSLTSNLVFSETSSMAASNEQPIVLPSTPRAAVQM